MSTTDNERDETQSNSEATKTAMEEVEALRRGLTPKRHWRRSQ
jgi:hypothetical protein